MATKKKTTRSKSTGIATVAAHAAENVKDTASNIGSTIASTRAHAWAVASATVATLRPSAVAADQARESGRAPTTTEWPESWLLRAWAWPWLP